MLDGTAALPPRRSMLGNTLPPAPPRGPRGPSSAVDQQISDSTLNRLQHLIEVERGGPTAVQIELAMCERDIFYWFKWYAWTYDPRNPLEMPPLPALLPFDLYPRQVEMINWLFEMMRIREDGCIKKSRGIGFTWLAGAFAWWHWRFRPGYKFTFGSRKTEYVDRLGDPDSIFEKIRLMYKQLPKWMLPRGFSTHGHDNHMLFQNPENGNTIRGEGGEEMGRGGRSTMYILDEAAKLEHADRVDAATSANADCRIWGSTINPHNENNLFQRKYTSFPPNRVFVFHYSAYPRYTPEWATRKKRSVTEENWMAEYEIDDSYTVEDICIPRSWVQASKQIRALINQKIELREQSIVEANALRAQGRMQEAQELQDTISRFQTLRSMEPRAEGIAGGDVGGGKAHSVVVARFGPIVTKPKAWTKPDSIDTAHKMLDYCKDFRLPKRGDAWEPVIKALRYDSVAIGQGVAAVMKRNPRIGLTVTGINTGDAPSETKWPDNEKACDKFFNYKAEIWWTARERFKRTNEMALWLDDIRDSDGEELGRQHPVEDLICIPDDPNDANCVRMADQLSQVKWTRRENGRIQIEPKTSLSARGVSSPDHADALMLTMGTTKAEKWAAFAKVTV